jgi:selenocysteine lyase/cysteine desulfurase
VTGTTRASIGCYTTREDLQALAAGLRKAVRLLR